MNKDEIHQHARRILHGLLLDGIEYSQVYEDEELEDADSEEWIAIQDRIHQMMSELAEAL